MTQDPSARPGSPAGHRIPLAGLAVALALAAPPAVAGDDDDWCRRHEGRRGGWHCEVREFVRPADGSTIAVDADPNGGVSVTAWERDEVRIEARVAARADTDAEARELASEIRIDTDGEIEAHGPRTRWKDKSWWVSFRLQVPARSDLRLEATNGGLSVTGVHGDLDLRTTNGGISLHGVGGDVRGRSTNGGLHVELEGDSWDGAGLDLRTTNGGIRLEVPEGYSARLETGTTNGRTEVEFPVTVQGEIGRRMEIDLGAGGAPIRVSTTNGSVRIGRR